MKGKPRFKRRITIKKEYKQGKWYTIDELTPDLPANFITAFFRKPLIDEMTPGGYVCTDESTCEVSEYELCIEPFVIKLILDYEKTEPGTDTDKK